jgi:pyrroloquinoline quinone (PQQ) biosynthesis protein C
MTTTMPLAEQLNESKAHAEFAGHAFFRNVKSTSWDSDAVAVLLGQWWHPLHYFPTFLARCVAVLPDIASKSAITRILNQEAGGGKESMAHEVIYADSMAGAGFDRAVVTGSTPFPETAELVAGYERGSAGWQSALGYIYATETTDLLMVSSIGHTVAAVTGGADNEWVRIHVQQEPDHVEEAEHALLSGFTPEVDAAVLAGADEMWQLWIKFFDRLVAETGMAS